MTEETAPEETPVEPEPVETTEPEENPAETEAAPEITETEDPVVEARSDDDIYREGFEKGAANRG